MLTEGSLQGLNIELLHKTNKTKLNSTIDSTKFEWAQIAI